MAFATRQGNSLKNPTTALIRIYSILFCIFSKTEFFLDATLLLLFQCIQFSLDDAFAYHADNAILQLSVFEEK